MDVVLGAPDLARWEVRPFWPAACAGPRPGDRRDRYARRVASEGAGEPEPGGPFRRLEAAILRFEVFPPRLIRGVLRRAPVEPGDAVGILYLGFGPLRLFFASRVLDRHDEVRGGVRRAGFTYRTLVGHPELGEETFSVEKDLASGGVSVELSSWSRPGTRLARAAAPLLRRVQVSANHQALEHLAAVAAGAAPQGAPG